MRHARRGRTIDTFRHRKSGITADIKYDRDARIFFATVLDRHHEADSVKALEQNLLRFVEENFATEWIEVLHVEINDSDRFKGTDSGFGLTYERFRLTRTAAGSWWRLEWNDQLDLKEAEYWSPPDRNRDFTLPHTYTSETKYASSGRHGANGSYSVAYSEALWVGLNQIGEQLNTLRDRLANLLGSAEGRKTIEDRALKLLGDGSEVEA